jgi:hypothetical protein
VDNYGHIAMPAVEGQKVHGRIDSFSVAKISFHGVYFGRHDDKIVPVFGTGYLLQAKFD